MSKYVNQSRYLYCLGKLGWINFIYFQTSANTDKQGELEFLRRPFNGSKQKLNPSTMFKRTIDLQPLAHLGSI